MLCNDNFQPNPKLSQARNQDPTLLGKLKMTDGQTDLVIPWLIGSLKL